MNQYTGTLTARFALLTAAMVLLVCGTSQWYVLREGRLALDMRLREKATFVNNFYAFLVADALQRKDDVTLLQVVNRLEEDSEITSVIVVDKAQAIRYDADSDKIGDLLKDPLVKNALATGEGTLIAGQNSGGKSLILVSPLKVQGQSLPIGAIRMEFTYHHVELQLNKVIPSFKIVVLGAIISWCGFVTGYVRKAVIQPLEIAKARIAAVNPALMDASLPEGPDEFGQLNASLNQMLVKLKTEMVTRQKESRNQGDYERQHLEYLTKFFLEGARILLVDKDNQIVSDSGDEGGQEPVGRHLLDLISDAAFANLVADAFQREGDVARGPIQWNGRPYDASVLHIPEFQTQLVKTLIALRPSAAMPNL